MKSTDFIELCTPYFERCSSDEETPDTLSFSEYDNDIYFGLKRQPDSLVSSRATSYSSIITELRETCSSDLEDGNESDVSPAVSPLNSLICLRRNRGSDDAVHDNGYYDHLFPKLNLSLSSFVSDNLLYKGQESKSTKRSQRMTLDEMSDKCSVPSSKRRHSISTNSDMCSRLQHMPSNMAPSQSMLRASSLVAFPSTRAQSLTNSTSCTALNRPIPTPVPARDMGGSVKCIKEKLTFFERELSSRQSTHHLIEEPQYEKVSFYGCYDKTAGWESTDDGLGSYVSSFEPEYEVFSEHDLCSVDRYDFKEMIRSNIVCCYISCLSVFS